MMVRQRFEGASPVIVMYEMDVAETMTLMVEIDVVRGSFLKYVKPHRSATRGFPSLPD